ncbi:MAG: DUF3502 domain-containing protein [Eubacterium ramulus]
MKYERTICYGYVVACRINIDADYQTAIDKLYEAGLQEYLDILQKQLDEYWEERS